MKIFLLIFTLFYCSCNEKLEQQKSTETPVEVRNEERILVKVAITNTSQEPLSFDSGGGLSKEITESLNKVQDKFYFEQSVLPVKRLEELGKSGKIHIAAFHNVNWGWDGMKVSKSLTMIKSEDVLIAHKKQGRSADFFTDIKNKSKVGVLGFHYNFLKNEDHLGTGKQYMETHSEKSVIDMLLLDRGEIGVVSKMTLQFVEKNEPTKYRKLLISNKFDSEYERYYVLMESSPINVEQLNELIKKLVNSGQLKNLYEKYGLVAEF